MGGQSCQSPLEAGVPGVPAAWVLGRPDAPLPGRVPWDMAPWHGAHPAIAAPQPPSQGKSEGRPVETHGTQLPLAPGLARQEWPPPRRWAGEQPPRAGTAPRAVQTAMLAAGLETSPWGSAKTPTAPCTPPASARTPHQLAPGPPAIALHLRPGGGCQSRRKVWVSLFKCSYLYYL